MVEEALLAVDKLGFRLGGDWLFRDVDLAVQPGQIVSIRGDNGAGKTTLLDLIAGDRRASEGTIALGGVRMGRQAPWRRARLGMGRLYQGVESLQSLSAREIIRLSAPWAAGPASEGPDTWLDALGLVGDRGAPSGQLSWGSQRLLALAGLFAMEPRLFVLDEPASGLSGPAMAKVSAHLREVCRTRGAGAVVVEHRRAFLEGEDVRRFVLTDQRLVAE